MSTWWWLSCKIWSDSCNTIVCSPPGSSVHGISQANNLRSFLLIHSNWPFGSEVKIPPANTGSFSGGTKSREPACQCRRHERGGFDPWVGKIPWRRAWQPTPVFLPGESYEQSYRPWDHKRVGHDLATKQQLAAYALQLHQNFSKEG